MRVYAAADTCYTAMECAVRKVLQDSEDGTRAREIAGPNTVRRPLGPDLRLPHLNKQKSQTAP